MSEVAKERRTGASHVKPRKYHDVLGLVSARNLKVNGPISKKTKTTFADTEASSRFPPSVPRTNNVGRDTRGGDDARRGSTVVAKLELNLSSWER